MSESKVEINSIKQRFRSLSLSATQTNINDFIQCIFAQESSDVVVKTFLHVQLKLGLDLKYDDSSISSNLPDFNQVSVDGLHVLPHPGMITAQSDNRYKKQSYSFLSRNDKECAWGCNSNSFILTGWFSRVFRTFDRINSECVWTSV